MECISSCNLFRTRSKERTWTVYTGIAIEHITMSNRNSSKKSMLNVIHVWYSLGSAAYSKNLSEGLNMIVSMTGEQASGIVYDTVIAKISWSVHSFKRRDHDLTFVLSPAASSPEQRITIRIFLCGVLVLLPRTVFMSSQRHAQVDAE